MRQLGELGWPARLSCGCCRVRRVARFRCRGRVSGWSAAASSSGCRSCSLRPVSGPARRGGRGRRSARRGQL